MPDYKSIGKLRHRVGIEQFTEKEDSFGQPVQAWESVLSPSADGLWWAYVRPLQGREALIARQIKATASDGVTLRYLGSIPITPLHRITFRGRTLGIVAVSDIDERRRQYELVCEEIESSLGPVPPL